MKECLIKSIKIIQKFNKFLLNKEIDEEDLENFEGIDLSKGFSEDFCNKALILDFDGTLRFSVGSKDYPELPEHVRILPNRTCVLKEYQSQGFRLLGASNQSAVSRGLSVEKCIACFERTLELLDVNIEYTFCTHNRYFECNCRKPLPGMGAYWILKYKLDPKQCIMVGDTETDKIFADNCGFNFSSAEDFFSTTWC